MIKRTLALGLLALALNIPAQAAQGAGHTATGDAQAGAAGSLQEAANVDAAPADDRAETPASAVPGAGHLAYALIGLGLLLGMLARRRR